MTLLRAVLALGLALGLQATLGRIWPGAHRYLDAMVVPVALYATDGSQRSAIVIGCLAGLLHDTWFHVGTFGITGFKLTLLGWALGGISARVDLGHPGGRMLAGAGLSLAQNLLDLPLRPLLGQQPLAWGAGDLLIQALLTGLLATLGGSIVDRVKAPRAMRHLG